MESINLIESTESLESLIKLIAEGKVSEQTARYKITEFMKTSASTVSYKINDDGGISFYGLRKLPIILYRNELDEIFTIYTSLQ